MRKSFIIIVLHDAHLLNKSSYVFAIFKLTYVLNIFCERVSGKSTTSTELFIQDINLLSPAYAFLFDFYRLQNNIPFMFKLEVVLQVKDLNMAAVGSLNVQCFEQVKL